MLVAVSIVVLVGAVAVIGFGGNDRARLAAEGAEIGRLLSEGRLRALETGQPQVVTLAEGVLTVGPVRHVVASGIAVTPDALTFAMGPTGASTGPTLTLARAEHEVQIAVDWLTGRVDVR